MADDLDSLVKGAPLPGREQPTSIPTSGVFDSNSNAGGNSADGGATSTGSIAASASAKAGDPLSHTPSSPSMIYLNLLILEASLRAQYLALRARRRHHTFFLLLLGAWILGFGYALFLAPREDGSGVGGSVYWVVDVLEKVCFMGGVITAALVWATGIWDRGVRWPRRWFSVSNRGLRHINCKLVLLKRPWWAEWLATLGWFLTYGLLSNSGGASSYRYVEPALLREVDRELNLNTGAVGGHQHPSVPSSLGSLDRDEEKGGSGGIRRHSSSHNNSNNNSTGHEEDLAPGGDYVKLLLLAKPFSPTFRENWELYRQEYWDRENERRALVRQKLKEQDRALRRATGGWLWWLPGRGTPDAHGHHLHHLHHHQQHRPYTPRSGGGGGGGSGSGGDGGNEKHGHHPQHPRHAAVEREHRRTRSNSSRRGSMSTVTSGGPTTSSRGATPALETEDSTESAVTRKTSTGSSASERRRKKSSASGQSGSVRASGTGTTARRPVSTSDSRSVTPDIPSPLAKESSFSSAGSEGRRGPRA